MATLVGATTVAAGVALISGVYGFRFERALLVGLASALAYSFSNIASKSGVQIQRDPFLSTAIGAAAGLTFISFYIAGTGQTLDLRIGSTSVAYFAATGI